jgi:hypothetical protein
VPRSSLTPILRFADVEAFVQAGQSKGGDDLVGFCQVGVAKEDQPHYIRLICLPDHDPAELISFGLSIIAERAHSRWTDRAASAVGLQRPDRGIVSAVRTYESPLEHHLEEHGFSEIARVSLLMREMAVRVTEPAMVPAATR